MQVSNACMNKDSDYPYSSYCEPISDGIFRISSVNRQSCENFDGDKEIVLIFVDFSVDAFDFYYNCGPGVLRWCTRGAMMQDGGQAEYIDVRHR